VDDPAVVAGLVRGNLGVFLHHGNPPIGVFFQFDLHGGGEADYASSNDHDIVGF